MKIKNASIYTRRSRTEYGLFLSAAAPLLLAVLAITSPLWN